MAGGAGGPRAGQRRTAPGPVKSYTSRHDPEKSFVTEPFALKAHCWFLPPQAPWLLSGGYTATAVPSAVPHSTASSTQDALDASVMRPDDAS